MTDIPGTPALAAADGGWGFPRYPSPQIFRE